MRTYKRTAAIGLCFLGCSFSCSVDDDGYSFSQGSGGSAGVAAGSGGGGGKAAGGSASGGRFTGGRSSGGAGDGGPAAGETGETGGSETGVGGDSGNPLKPSGEDCSDANECESGFCRDGLCCSSECAGACQACARASTGVPDGTCAAVIEGADPHDDCDAAEPESCGDDGSCDGDGGCKKYGPRQVCAAAVCSGVEFTPAGTCDGAGSCSTEDPIDCGEFPCSDEGCETPCSIDDDCPTGSYCATAVCRACPTGNKVCNGSCIPIDECCGGCSGDRPVCENAVCVKKSLGDACTQDAQCDSGNCVDDFCCDSECTGQCQSCSATPGTCKAVTTPRMPCNGSGTCGGVCNGTNGMSCVYPAAETSCAAASCTAGMAYPAVSCNGSGACSTPTATSCAYGCKAGGTTCNLCRQKSDTNLLQNPGFDGNAMGWSFVGGAAYQPTPDAENCSTSGSVLIETLSHEMKQCRPASPNTYYSFGFRFRGTGPSDEPSSFCAMIFYKGSGCTTSSATSNIVTVTALGNLTSWVHGSGTATSPADAGSVLIDCAGQGGFGYYDYFYLSTESATY